MIWYTEEFTIDSVTSIGPVSAKQAKNNQPSTRVMDSWYEVFVLMCCVWFSANVALCIVAKHLQFLLTSVQRKLFQKSYGLFRCNFADPSHAAVFF